MNCTTSAAWAFDRYCEIRHRLPLDNRMENISKQPISVTNLHQIAADFDVFLFDSFGVLNVGNEPVEGAADRVAELRATGKKVFVLTNAATTPLSRNRDKYQNLGFEFSDQEIISSRYTMNAYLRTCDPEMIWGVAGPEQSEIQELPCRTFSLDRNSLNSCDGVILLSSAEWSEDDQDLLVESLSVNPRTVLVGNPDLVAPRKCALSKEPGYFAHDLTDRLDIQPIFFGKPFSNAFEEAFSRISPLQDRSRVLMIGDTLHTDILGGLAFGCKTALVTDHGLLSGMDINVCVRRSKIVPDYIIPSI